VKAGMAHSVRVPAMGVGDIAGVFSRYFVVGFFLPAFAVLVLLSLTVSDCLIPNEFERQSAAAQVAILGVGGLLLGLLLQGLSYPLLRGYEGYGFIRSLEWLNSPRRRPYWRRLAHPIESLRDRLLAKQVAGWKELRQARRGVPNSAMSQADAAWRLRRQFPEKRAHLLATTLGNSIRAFETAPNDRWGLDGIAIAPHIGAFMTDKEHEIQADAKAEVMFFLNGSALSFVLGFLWLTGWLAEWLGAWYWPVMAFFAFGSGYVAYRGAVGAARRWGSVVASQIDLHRLELYASLGIRDPQSFTDERTVVGPAVSRCVLHGNHLPDNLRREPRDTEE